MKDIIFKGCGTAIATPFKDGNVNLDEFKRLVKFQIENKADSIIVCGTTGESPTLSVDEKIELIKCAVEVSNKKIPIIAGTGSNDTKKAIKMSKIAEDLGSDGLLIVTPYYNKCTQNGLIEYYKSIAKSVSIPIIMYNVPSRTGVNITPETCLELSKIPNIVAIKEASGNISQVAKIASLCKNNLQIYSGNDDQILPVLSLGGIGVISVLANIKPNEVHKMCYDYFDGNIQSASKIQLENLSLINTLFDEVNPIPIKYALKKIGFDVGVPRSPLTPVSSNLAEKLDKLLQNDN